MRVLLTGCQGFIGKNINDALMKHEGVISVYGIEKDYMNYEGWEKSLEKSVKECDVILHVGAISDTMLQDPNEMMKYNFEFSRILFDLAETNGKKVVYSSSAANKGDGGHTPSNLYGWSKYIAEKYGLFVLEDAAHAVENSFNNKKEEYLNHAVAFSFYANKNITSAGEGGALATSNKKLAHKIKKLSHLRSRRAKSQ